MVIPWNIYIFLKNRKQCRRINNVSGDFNDIISGVPQGSIVGSILFNAYLNDLFFCIRKASAHKFADNNTPSSFVRSVKLLLKIQITEPKNAIKWFSDSKIIANPKQI